MSSRFSIEAVVSMIDKVSGPMKNAGKSVSAFSSNTEKHFGGIRSTVGSVLGAAGIFGGGALAFMGMKKIVSEAANFENAVANFTTLLGGSEVEAGKLVKNLQVLGAETPFEFKDLAAATQRLLGFGVVTKDTAIPTLRMLGDLAQGNAEKLQGISLVYGQVMAGGKMMGQDFNQLINQGVPIAQGLAKVWGVDVNEAIKRVKQNGPVAAKDVQAAMVQMTSAGGMFYQGMLRSSKTLTGLWSTFQDAISMTAAGIGTELLPTIKELVISMTNFATSILTWVQNNKQFIANIVSALKMVAKTLPYVIGLFIAWKTVLFLSSAATLISTIRILGLIGAMQYYNVAANKINVVTKLWTAAQWLLNASLFGCPIIWIVLGIMALIAVGVLLYKNWDTVTAFISSAWETVKTNFIAGVTAIWEGIKMVGRGILTYMMMPINLLLSGIIALLNLASKIPGIGGKFAAAAEWAQGFQNNMNQTLGTQTAGQVINNFSSPNSEQIANGGGNVNGKVAIDINSNVKDTSMSQKNMPSYINTNLNTGYQP